MITIVAPVYNGQKTIAQLLNRLDAVAQGMGETFQVILVDDASTDHSWQLLKHEARERAHLQVYQNPKNLGQHPTLFAGLRYATAPLVVVMDGDLQDKPEEIPALHRAMNIETDVVLARRKERQDTVLKQWASRGFYTVLRYLFGVRMQPEVANFGMYRKSVIDAVLQSKYRTFFPLAIQKQKPNLVYVDVQHDASASSQYTLSSRLKLAYSIVRNELRYR